VPDLKDNKNISGRFFAELYRRGVLRAGLAYLILSLLIALLISYTKSLINLPVWFNTVFIIVLTVGFPIALYLAWKYERSPQGFVRTNSDKSWQNPLNAGQRKPLTGNYVIAFLTITVIVLLIIPKIKPGDASEILPEEQFHDKSIAVLPFTNMSNDPDQEYFSDGMMEEILNHLFKIGDLHVTSRTSVMRYKGTTKPITEIARELGVSTILEGSVRKSGDRVRITVQLIDGKSDKHLWAETYDRQLFDVFAIQSEVAQTIATSLQAEVQPEVLLRIESQPTKNTEAYNLYLETRKLNPYDEEENARAIKMFEEVISMDPNFSRAYVGLGVRLQTGATLFVTEGGMDPSRAWIISKPYFEKALLLDPDNAQAHQRMAWSKLWFEWDFEGAEQAYNETKKIYPNYSWTDFLVATGDFKEAIRGAERTMEIDPTAALSWAGIIIAQYFEGEYQKVLKTIEKSLEDPVQSYTLFTLSESSRVYMYLGKYEEAQNIVRIIREENPDIESPRMMAIDAISRFHLGNQKEVEKIVDELIDKSQDNAGGSPSFYLAMIYAQMGEIDTAYQWLDKSFQDHEVEMYWLKVEPPFEPLRSDPRWQVMLDKVGFPEI
jgi:TolB-like protein